MGVQANQIKVACICSNTHIVNHFINMNLGMTNMTAMDINTVLLIFRGTMPIDTIRRLSSHGCLEPLANVAEDFELCNEPEWTIESMLKFYCLSLASQRQELLEFCLRTYFPFLQDLPPRQKRFILFCGSRQERWTADGLRHIISPDGPIQPIDTKAWNDDGVSILHVVFSYYLMQLSKAEAGNFKTLLEEAIQATDDVHHASESDFYFNGIAENCSALQQGLLTSLHDNFRSTASWKEGRTTRAVLEGLTTALQSLMSVLASYGYDLLEFGRQEAVTWFGQCNAGSNVGGALYLGFRYDEVRQVRVVHYGAEPRDWYFELDFHYEDYVGAFWNLVENPHLFEMPGAWIDEEWDSDWA